MKAKDSKEAFAAIKFLVNLSEESPVLYPYTSDFIEMLHSDKYVIRVRGFKLLCKQAKWDTDKLINNSLNSCLQILNDEKPTAVRQALAALYDVVKFKPELRAHIQKATQSIKVENYNEDTMRPIIEKDIAKLQQFIFQSERDKN